MREPACTEPARPAAAMPSEAAAPTAASSSPTPPGSGGGTSSTSTSSSTSRMCRRSNDGAETVTCSPLLLPASEHEPGCDLKPVEAAVDRLHLSAPAPGSTVPEPDAPESTAPESTVPEPAAPEPAAPESTAPESTAPEPAAPAPAPSAAAVQQADSTRTKLVKELLSTEITYVESLEVLSNVFITPLESRRNLPAELAVLFRSVRVLLGLNQTFLNEMKERIDEWSESQCFGDVFLHFAPFMKMYVSYVQQHDDATQCLQACRSRNDGIVRHLNAFAQDPLCKGLGLESFLILPVQRIPRYKLLLEAVLKKTDALHRDHESLCEALRQTSSVAMQINEGIRDRESRSRIIALQNRFSGDVQLVAPSRRLARIGPLTKVCRARNQQYEFILFNDLLIYARPVPGRATALKLHRWMPIDNNFEVHDLPSRVETEFPFQIRSATKSFEVRAQTHTDKIEWLLALMTCIQQQRQRTGAPSFDADAEPVQAPVWQPNHASARCSNCNSAFSLLKRRHHCRSCGCLVCSECSPHRELRPDGGGSVRVCDLCHRSNQASTPSRVEGERAGSVVEGELEPEPEPEFEPKSDPEFEPKSDPGRSTVSSTVASLSATVAHEDDSSVQRRATKAESEAREEPLGCVEGAAAPSTIGGRQRRSPSPSRRPPLTRRTACRTAASTSSSGLSRVESGCSRPSLEYMRALVDSNSSSPAELRFECGDVLLVQQKHDSGWWMGGNTRTGESGWFGPACAERIGEHSSCSGGSVGVGGGGGCGIGAAAIATCSFDGSTQHMLRLQRGQRVEIVSECVDGMYSGIFSGRSGNVPANVIGRIENGVASVLEDTSGFDMLSLIADESVRVLDARNDNWWFGEDAQGVSGWFPASHVVIGREPERRPSLVSCEMCSDCCAFVPNQFRPDSCSTCQHAKARHFSLVQ